MASIDHLDNPLLLLIFNHLSIQELFPVGHVCVRWNEVRINSARARRELVLLIGNDAQSYIEESGLRIPKGETLLDENGDVMFPKNDQREAQMQIYACPLDFASLLYAHFENLTKLTISTRSYTKEIDSFIHLLEQFNRTNGTLHTLKLYSSHDKLDTELNTNHFYSYNRFLIAANEIGSLRKLTYDVNAKFENFFKFIRIDLPILAKLEEFEFNTADNNDCIQHSIMKYAVGNLKLRSISIQFPIQEFVWLLSLSVELSSRFTHLHLLLNSTNSLSFVYLCRQFTRLTSLEITYKLDTFTIFELFRPLTNLPNLLSLTLNIEGTALRPVARNARGQMHFELPSVKVLTINIAGWALSHHFMHNCNMICVFPNVQVVRVIQEKSHCFKCDSSCRVDEEQCVRNMFRHFTHSQHLRTVCYKIADKNNGSVIRFREWAWNEMEPFEEEVAEDEEVGLDEINHFENLQNLLVGFEKKNYREFAKWY